MLDSKVLKAENFLLRELNYSDTEELFTLCSKADVKDYIPGFYTASIQDVQHIFVLANLDKSILLGIENNDGKVIGIIYAYIKNTFDFAKISFLLDDTERGKGIMSKALKLFINYLYSNRSVSNIVFDVRIDNKSSIRLLEKLNIPRFFAEDCFKYHLSLTKELPF